MTELAPVDSSLAQRPAGPPPRCGFLDDLATRIEGGGTGAPVETMVDLWLVLGSEGASLAPPVEHFYAAPLAYELRAGVRMNWWSRVVMAPFIALARQMRIPEGGPSQDTYPVDQRLYRDAFGRLHWDRYVRARGSWRRLFTARLAAERGALRETFVTFGVPLTLTFRATAEHGALALRLDRRASSLAARLCEVKYRTAATNSGIVTRGDFRIPMLGVRVGTTFVGSRVARSATAPSAALRSA